MAKQFTLGKNERLKSRKQIELLFRKGKVFSIFPFRVYYNAVSMSFPLQFGIGVSSRNFKKAVDRNRIKRLTREAWRLQKSILYEELEHKGMQMNVFFIYTAKELPAYNFVYEKAGAAIKKLQKIVNENHSLDT